ncbi:class I SAM-dependent methyltransferase [Bacillus sp. H-16]|uniref:class I SAM-dependent methyltransferase n=1 Tax=Alteribacter salitolerans TaxID=2912333 RepID=UPI00196524E8|nr:class I SAM-dependent methyltransferase [Alteribacter salitolerans]MBM7094485.1 class I SAM-dependent methyltransferase [Alteribacter salitolerans]
MRNNVYKDNLQPYENPEGYDEKNDKYVEDIHFFKKWAAGKEGPVIDLACGTGRVTLPLAENGISLMGVDIHPGMLSRAKEKAEAENLTVHFFEQDCCSLSLPVQTDFIYMTGNSFQHFLTNDTQDRLLQSVKAHLVKGGMFVFGTRFPQAGELISAESTETIHKREGDSQITYTSTESYDPVEQILYCESKTFIDERLVDTDRIKLRYVYPQEMKRVLETNGFSLTAVYGDWDESPLTKHSTNMIVVCEKAENA